ncbi:uncharacterized protein KGF55_003553 [Candida pseudojiufengensis]|uniref:uncharacterized protein n=1 Tax=Candida pseudojiufengensis TaxID=497109 RepID=UPI0022253E7B|nr:uncharacterized protein KGF55_003553 [Candida pseudojiufengensis]KAI5962477.1 hypothetical protein KGF55_003553 [Candida pseudojiufengensis]
MTISSSDEISLNNLTSNNDKITLICPFRNCSTKIIQYNPQKLKSEIIENAPSCIEIENYPEVKEPKLSTKTTKFFKIDDVWSFVNIGVSRPSEISKDPIIISTDDNDTTTNKIEELEGDSSGQIKVHIERLLICSECDRGPLGFAGIEDGKENDHKNLKYFLSENSVLYDY